MNIFEDLHFLMIYY